MIKSMTGFARAETQSQLGALTFEVRTVNHRYLEVSVRLPEECRVLEGQIRERVAARISRGKVDVGLKFHKAEDSAAAFDVNRELLSSLGKAAAEIEAQWPGTLAGSSATDVMRWPGVLNEVAQDPAPLHAAAMTLFEGALDDLVSHREREGGRLGEMLRERLNKVTEQVVFVRQHLEDMRSSLLAKMRQRVDALGVDVEEGRLEQEVAMLAQKADVAEELDRLDSHVAEGLDVLALDEPIGRRLDFLMQEFNREANTLASKSQDTACTKASVELKVLIEQMREQVQNVE
ncbi:MAG: YicC/YloC family endoribonuclease [Gammaproteobacteria bacterium]